MVDGAAGFGAAAGADAAGAAAGEGVGVWLPPHAAASIYGNGNGTTTQEWTNHERRRASSKPTPPRMTNNTAPVIASGNCPVPPKYTPAAIDSAASENTAMTADADGLLVPIP